MCVLKQMLQPLSAARITRTSVPLGKDVDLTALAIKIIYPSMQTTKIVGGQVLLYFLTLAVEGQGVPVSLWKMNCCSFSFSPSPASDFTVKPCNPVASSSVHPTARLCQHTEIRKKSKPEKGIWLTESSKYNLLSLYLWSSPFTKWPMYFLGWREGVLLFSD